ncbi:hypothetical protein LINGRAHAP2_LOCUS9734 [Linum grandiflorum]
MPDNQVGSRIHNFFGEDISSQVQQHSQIADAAWPGISMNPWGGSQGQITTPFISDLKSRSLQESVADYEGGYDSQAPTMQREMRFEQSIQRTEHGRNQSQGQLPAINGYFQGHQGFQTSQSAANYSGVRTESERNNLTQKGFSMFGSHQGNGSEYNERNPVQIKSSESPVNFDFFGGQHQVSAHNPEVMQSLSQQPLGTGDIMLQQQLILKQMQEFQRQRQLQMQQRQQQDSRHLNSLNQVSSPGVQTLGRQSQSLITGIPVQDASGYGLQPEIMAANTNWQQKNMSGDMRRSSTGLEYHPEQNQALQLMGMVPHQADQSLYGVPISGPRVNSTQFSHIQMDNAPSQPMSSNSSFLANQYNGSSNHMNVQDGTQGLRQGYQVGNETGGTNIGGFDSGINLKHLQQLNSLETRAPSEEYHTREQGILPESSHEKPDIHVSSQNAAKLDPTEEKILYGSDDNLWDAFSSSNHAGSGGFNATEGSDTLDGAFPSLGNGIWSALMQSAVAETSSVDMNTQEESSGPSGQATATRHFLSVNDAGKQQTAWVGNSSETVSTLNNSFNFSGDPSAKIDSHPWTNQSDFSLHNPRGEKFIGQSDRGRTSAPFTHGFPYKRTRTGDLNTQETGREASINQSANNAFDNFVSQMKQKNEAVDGAQSSQSGQTAVLDTSRGTAFSEVASSAEVSRLNNYQNDKDSGQHFPVLEPTSTSQSYAVPASQQDEFSRMYSTVRTSTSPSFGTPFRASSNLPQSDIQSNSISKTTSWPQKSVYQYPQASGSDPSATGASSVKLGLTGKEEMQKDESQLINPINDLAQKVMSPVQGNDLILNRASSLNASSFASTQMNIAAFGRSLRPIASLNQKYSLLHQVEDMKKTEMDPNDRSLKRLKASDGLADPQLASSGSRQQLYGYNNMVKGASLNNACSSPGDPNLVSISGKQTDDQGPNLPSHDMQEFSGKNSGNFTDTNMLASGRDENSKVSLQMAPSWFSQYGTLKHGQVLSTNDAGKVSVTKHPELPPSAGRSTSTSLQPGNSIGDISNHGRGLTPPNPIVSNGFSFPQLPRPNAVDMSLFVVRPKKRKSATCDLVPWRKEVLMIPQRLRNLSLAESEWAKTVNRVREKVEDDGGMIVNGPPALKSKRRLILTTQLMQLLLHPPPAWVICGDADYESAGHLVARSTLGDACSSLSASANDTEKMVPESGRMSKSASDQHLLKVAEDLVSRISKVEIDLNRMDKRLSVVDLRVECEDLERFSVINRFAKFHSPGGPTADTSSSSGTTGSANVQMYFLQRYVTAVPFPRNVPDRVLCLSL